MGEEAGGRHCSRHQKKQARPCGTGSPPSRRLGPEKPWAFLPALPTTVPQRPVVQECPSVMEAIDAYYLELLFWSGLLGTDNDYICSISWARFLCSVGRDRKQGTRTDVG